MVSFLFIKDRPLDKKIRRNASTGYIDSNRSLLWRGKEYVRFLFLHGSYIDKNQK